MVRFFEGTLWSLERPRAVLLGKNTRSQSNSCHHATCSYDLLLNAAPVCDSEQVVNVLGSNITGEECVVLVRAGGEYLPATCLPLDPALAAYVATMNLELVHLQVCTAQSLSLP